MLNASSSHFRPTTDMDQGLPQRCGIAGSLRDWQCRTKRLWSSGFATRHDVIPDPRARVQHVRRAIEYAKDLIVDLSQ